MPIDHKRINGPDESVPYELFARSATKAKPTPALSQQELDVDACDQRKICKFASQFHKTLANSSFGLQICKPVL